MLRPISGMGCWYPVTEVVDLCSGPSTFYIPTVPSLRFNDAMHPTAPAIYIAGFRFNSITEAAGRKEWAIGFQKIILNALKASCTAI